MTQTTSPQVTYRRTQGGQWAVMGPADVVRVGATVTVTKRSGQTKTEYIASVGKTFVRDGVGTRYGYTDRREDIRTADSASHQPQRRQSRPMCDECGERRAVTTARDLSGLVGDVCGTCARSGALSFA